MANLYKITFWGVLVFALAGDCFATDRHDVIETVNAHGHINWSKGIAYANGGSMIRENDAEKIADGSPLDKAALHCPAHLFDTVKNIRVDASCLVKDLIEQNDMVREQLWAMVKGAHVARREYLSDGTVETTLAFSMKGGFAQLALPENIKYVPQIKTISRDADAEEKPKSKPTLEGSVYSGLILDARGLKGRPAMAPTIVSESGEEIYGPAIVSREYAVQQGMAAFETDMAKAMHHSRVMDNPIVVRGLRVRGPAPCNFVISDADARKIRSSSKNLSFLKQCRVIFVLD
jgi:hypothetical protein